MKTKMYYYFIGILSTVLLICDQIQICSIRFGWHEHVLWLCDRVGKQRSFSWRKETLLKVHYENKNVRMPHAKFLFILKGATGLIKFFFVSLQEYVYDLCMIDL